MALPLHVVFEQSRLLLWLPPSDRIQEIKMKEIQGEMVQQQTTLRNGKMNKVQPGDREAHNWYRSVLSYPPHLVRNYLEKFSDRLRQ